MLSIQIPADPVPVGAPCSDGLDVDGHHAGPHQLAQDGGHIC